MWIRSACWWRWMIVGALAGLAVALAELAGGDTGAGAVGMGQAEFERLLAEPPAMGRYPALDEICIVPVGEGYWVRMLRRYPLADGNGFEYRTRWLALRGRAYRPMDGTPAGGAAGGGYTVRTYLEEASRRDARVKFRYAWEKDEKIALPVFVLGGALLLGAAWPAGARLILGPRPAESAVLDSGRAAQGDGGQAHAAGPSAGDLAQLARLEAEMEARLGADANANAAETAGGRSAGGQGDGAAAPALNAGPLEAAPAAPESRKQYDGEYYPTETHVKHD